MIELTGAKSDGEAAYADRAMDGAKFSRDNVGLKFSQEHLSSLVQSLDAQVYYNYVDHVMDNYSLRTFTATTMMPNPAVSNPDRETTGGFSVFSLNAGWKPMKALQLTAGIDNVFDKLYAEHLSRGGSAVAGYTTTTRVNEMGRSLWLSANLSF